MNPGNTRTWKRGTKRWRAWSAAWGNYGGMTKSWKQPDKHKEEKAKVTSPTLGTGRKRLWLLRSRPDQVDRATMRGGPSRRIISEKDRHAHYPKLSAIAIQARNRNIHGVAPAAFAHADYMNPPRYRTSEVHPDGAYRYPATDSKVS